MARPSKLKATISLPVNPGEGTISLLATEITSSCSQRYAADPAASNDWLISGKSFDL